MILKGNQRAGSMQLARHLMNDVDNDHITVHELRGFVSDTLFGALKEIHAISIGTRCKQFLFSLSLNPPLTEDVPVEDFEAAIEAVELKLGLTGQPRAIVFHEKQGRRHAHCVWSRIDIETMTAINLPYFKTKLQDISRELFIQYQWAMPAGLENHQSHDPLNYSNAECQQAKRVKRDPKELKRLFQSCWSVSDNQNSFAAALREKGFILAKGDRRGHVAVDKNGEIYAISRWVGVKAKAVRAKLGEPIGLPSIEEALALLSGQLSDGLIDQSDSIEQSYQDRLSKLINKRDDLVTKQRKVREELTNKHEKRRVLETLERQSKLPTGLTKLWQVLSGGYSKIQHTNALAFQQCQKRDRLESLALIQQQLRERRRLQAEIEQLEFDHLIRIKSLGREIGRHLRIDPTQPFIIPDDRPPNIKTRIQKDPAHVLAVITERKESFTRQDIICELDRYIDQPTALNTAIAQVMGSSALVEITNDPTPTYSTREFIQTKATLAQLTKQMSKIGSQGIPRRHINTAIQSQNRQLQSKVGANLSDEQCRAIKHILDEKQLSIVVGLAGSGKSTMLAAAHDAWRKQGRRIIGAALAGKAADELQNASNIESRTLASWALSWKNGYSQLQKGDVLVIDEAGMIGSKQLLEFVKAARG